MKSFFLKEKDEFSKTYNLTKTLGTGSFATVKMCTLKSDKNVMRACKIMNLTNMKADDMEALQTEMKILFEMDHPNIVKLFETFRGKKNMYLVMELMTGGEMFDRIVEKEHYDEATARRDLTQIANALQYCHKNFIVHRDLKPENLLYADETPESIVKLADFGLAKVANDDPFMTTACGTPGYVAPEILSGQAYGAKVDVWSFGIIAYILLCGFPPFYHSNNSELFKLIKKGNFTFPSPYWDHVTTEAKDFIMTILIVDPAQRPTITEVLKSPWMVGEANSDLSGNIPRFKEYNASRKFKNAVTGIQAVNRMRNTLDAIAPTAMKMAVAVKTTNNNVANETTDNNVANETTDNNVANETTDNNVANETTDNNVADETTDNNVADETEGTLAPAKDEVKKNEE